jgi:branched-chain amino acid transport system permease protein
MSTMAIIGAVLAAVFSAALWRNGKRGSELVQPAAFAFSAALLPAASSLLNTISDGTGDTWLPLTTVVFCGIYATFALGLNVVVGYAGLLDLGYVAFVALGAYAGAWLMSDFWHQIDPGFHFGSGAFSTDIPGIHLSFWIILVVATMFCAVWGVIIGAPTLRLKSDYLALVTLGFGEIIPQIAVNGDNIGGYNITNGSSGIGPVDRVNMTPFDAIPGVATYVGPFDFTTRYYIVTVALVAFLFVSLRLRDGKLGRAWLAVREDELAASLMGVPLMRTKLWAYAVGAAAGGLGGAFFVITLGNIDPTQFKFQISVMILVMVIIGGMGNVYGVVLASFVLTWLNYTGMTEIGNKINAGLGTSIDLPSWQFLIFGLILVLMMLFRPDGLLPAARQKQVRKMEAQLETLGTEGAQV